MRLRDSRNMHGFNGVFKSLNIRTFQQVGACDFLRKEVILLFFCNSRCVSIGFRVFLFASYAAKDNEPKWNSEFSIWKKIQIT